MNSAHEMASMAQLVLDAHERIRSSVVETPLELIPGLTPGLPVRVLFKLENLSERILLVAPRSLKDPVRYRFSSLNRTRTGRPGVKPGISSSGVSTTEERILSCASRTSCAMLAIS